MKRPSIVLKGPEEFKDHYLRISWVISDDSGRPWIQSQVMVTGDFKNALFGTWLQFRYGSNNCDLWSKKGFVRSALKVFVNLRVDINREAALNTK